MLIKTSESVAVVRITRDTCGNRFNASTLTAPKGKGWAGIGSPSIETVKLDAKAYFGATPVNFILPDGTTERDI